MFKKIHSLIKNVEPYVSLLLPWGGLLITSILAFIDKIPFSVWFVLLILSVAGMLSIKRHFKSSNKSKTSKDFFKKSSALSKKEVEVLLGGSFIDNKFIYTEPKLIKTILLMESSKNKYTQVIAYGVHTKINFDSIILNSKIRIRINVRHGTSDKFTIHINSINDPNFKESCIITNNNAEVDLYLKNESSFYLCFFGEHITYRAKIDVYCLSWQKLP